MKIYRDIIKPILDVVLALVFVILFWWLYLLIAILVRTKLGSPVLFVQERPGRIDRQTGKEKIIKLHKFRTMTNARDENGGLLPDEQRLTRFGKFLRSTSMDELPEIFFNILLGGGKDLSWIGPRPLLVDYLPRYSKEQRRRHEVVPGLTGYAQVCGRNAISWEKKFEYDVWYVDHISFLLDLKVLFLTVKVVFAREGISSDTSVTMEEFMGSENDK